MENTDVLKMEEQTDLQTQQSIFLDSNEPDFFMPGGSVRDERPLATTTDTKSLGPKTLAALFKTHFDSIFTTEQLTDYTVGFIRGTARCLDFSLEGRTGKTTYLVIVNTNLDKRGLELAHKLNSWGINVIYTSNKDNFTQYDDITKLVNYCHIYNEDNNELLGNDREIYIQEKLLQDATSIKNLKEQISTLEENQKSLVGKNMSVENNNKELKDALNSAQAKHKEEIDDLQNKLQESQDKYNKVLEQLKALEDSVKKSQAATKKETSSEQPAPQPMEIPDNPMVQKEELEARQTTDKETSQTIESNTPVQDTFDRQAKKVTLQTGVEIWDKLPTDFVKQYPDYYEELPTPVGSTDQYLIDRVNNIFYRLDEVHDMWILYQN